MTTKSFKASMLFLLAFLPETIFADVIACTRGSVDAMRVAAQSHDLNTPKMAKRLTVCSSYSDEVSFWWSFYFGTSRQIGSRPGGITTNLANLSGPAGDLRAARLASKNLKWSDARIRYESYLVKRPNDFQIRVEREFTLIWEEKFLDAEKRFDELLKTDLPSQFKNEAILGRNLALRLQKKNSKIEKTAKSSESAAVTETPNVSSAPDRNHEGWVNIPSVTVRDGSDTLKILTVGVRTNFAKVQLYDDQMFFQMDSSRINSDTSGLRSQAQIVGLSSGSRLAFGEGFQLIGKIGYLGVAKGVFHGQLKSQFTWNQEITYAIGIVRDPLILLVPLNTVDYDLARNSIVSELSWRQILQSTYAVSREKEFTEYEKLDLNFRWGLSGNSQKSADQTPLSETTTNLLISTSLETHPRASAYYKTYERVSLVRVGYELNSSIPKGWLSSFNLQAIAGTAFIKSRYPKGKNPQIGVWSIKGTAIQSWSKSISSNLSADHQAAAVDVNENILQRKTTITASLIMNL